MLRKEITNKIMTLAQRIKRGLKKIVPAAKITYKAKPEKLQSTLSPEQRRKARSAAPVKKTNFKQYGDKGYTPSNGRGVGI